ncbi:hypothetical protein E4U52_000829 [Claviceps spartinae]|nr:hypothetical protein E4U52_000829 [Claviceps spartinae]
MATSGDSDDEDVKERDLITWQITGPVAFTAETSESTKPELTLPSILHMRQHLPCTPESNMVNILRDNALAHAMFGEDPLYMEAEEIGNHCHISEERYAGHIKPCSSTEDMPRPEVLPCEFPALTYLRTRNRASLFGMVTNAVDGGAGRDTACVKYCVGRGSSRALILKQFLYSARIAS